MMAMMLGFTSNQIFAQKKANKVACFKSNMDCADCETTITEYLKFEKGVKDLKVDHFTNTIKVEYKSGKNDSKGFAKAIEKKGYLAKEISEDDYKKIVGDQEHKHKEHKEK